MITKKDSVSSPDDRNILIFIDKTVPGMVFLAWGRGSSGLFPPLKILDPEADQK